MQLKAGSRLQSRVCATQIIVVKAPPADVDITCGGVSMVEAGSNVEPATAIDGLNDGAAMGKRYTDPAQTLEVLCTKPGAGTLGLGGDPLELKEAKALPASD